MFGSGGGSGGGLGPMNFGHGLGLGVLGSTSPSPTSANAGGVFVFVGVEKSGHIGNIGAGGEIGVILGYSTEIGAYAGFLTLGGVSGSSASGGVTAYAGTETTTHGSVPLTVQTGHGRRFGLGRYSTGGPAPESGSLVFGTGEVNVRGFKLGVSGAIGFQDGTGDALLGVLLQSVASGGLGSPVVGRPIYMKW